MSMQVRDPSGRGSLVVDPAPGEEVAYIVKGLASILPDDIVRYWDEGCRRSYYECVLCEAEFYETPIAVNEHRESCPWRQAREVAFAAGWEPAPKNGWLGELSQPEQKKAVR